MGNYGWGRCEFVYEDWEIKINKYIKAVAVLLCFGLSACGTLKEYKKDDPFEDINRGVHQFNLILDSNIVRPVAVNYVAFVKDDVRLAVANVAENLSTPGYVANNLLQGDLQSALDNTLKFFINSTLGLGGIGKPAENFGISGEEADFGETLHNWGFKEGPFLVIPVLGPSTTRGLLGATGDLVLDPLGYLSEQLQIFSYSIRAADIIGDRGAFADSVDSILYGSTDSYHQMKIIFLQARRFELDGNEDHDYFDPYELF